MAGGFVRGSAPMRPIWIVFALALSAAACAGDEAPATAVRTTAPPDVAAPPANATRTASGLAFTVLAPGSGTMHPSRSDRVTVHYSGWTTDGRLFDSSVARGEPATFRLDQVIEGWTEGLQLMVPGETRRFWIPEDLAYKGRQPPTGMLVFDVELIAIP